MVFQKENIRGFLTFHQYLQSGSSWVFHSYLTWRFILLLLACIGLSACAGTTGTAVPTTPPDQATEIDEAPTKLPVQTVPLTVAATTTPLPTVTTAPPTPPATLEPATPTSETIALSLAAIANLLNISEDLQDLPALMTREFRLHPLPYVSQQMPRSQAVPNIRTYLGLSPQIKLTEVIPNEIDITEWVGDTADYIAYSTGWGIHGTMAGLMLFTYQGTEVLWSGPILSADNFAPMPKLATVPPPYQLTYQLENQIFTVLHDGVIALFQGKATGEYTYLINPTNSHVLEIQYDRERPYRLGQATLIELAIGSRQPLEMPYLVALYGMGWLDERTMGMGVWLDEEDALGQTPGRPLVLDVLSGEWELLADHHATISQIGNGRMVYTHEDEFVVWRDTGATSYPLMLGGLPTLSHSEQQWILRTGAQFTLVTPEEQIELLTYRAFHPQGRFLAQVAWSPDDSWIALRPAPTDLELDGVWLYAPGEGEMIYLGSGTSNPLWQDNRVALFNVMVAGEMALHAYDVVTAERVKVDVPEGSIPIHFVSADQ